MPCPLALQAVGDLLKGSSKSGAFQLDHKVSYAGTTSSGLNVTISAVAKGDKVDPTLKAAYAKKGYSADVTYDGSAKIAVNSSVADVLPGLKLSGSVSLPDANSAKASAEYSFPYLSTKATVTLTSKPVVDVVASTGYKDVIVGVEAGFDTAKSTVGSGGAQDGMAGGHGVPRGSSGISFCLHPTCSSGPSNPFSSLLPRPAGQQVQRGRGLPRP